MEARLRHEQAIVLVVLELGPVALVRGRGRVRGKGRVRGMGRVRVRGRVGVGLGLDAVLGAVEGLKQPPKSCMPSSEKMTMTRNMSTKRLAICGMLLMKVMQILYSPFHDFIRRSMRSTRSMRRMRRKERLAPPAATMVATMSTTDMRTIEPAPAVFVLA